MKRLRIASRASKLALAQAEMVKKSLEKLSADIEVSVVKITTKGDRDRSDFLYKSESVGLFSSEVNNSVLDGRADLAVHSLKDLPTTNPPELVIAAIPEREFVADALVASRKAASIEDLPGQATVGTSSLRRIAQIKHLRNDLKCVALRGNVETRVRKVAGGELDAAIVAYAGLKRLGIGERISTVIDPEQFLTAPGQGALAVQAKTSDSELLGLLSKLDHKPTRIATEAERCVLATMKGGCSIPLGVYARIIGDRLVIDAMISDISGRNLIRRSCSSPISQSKACARKLAQDLLEAGGKEILERIRQNGRDLKR